MLPVFKFLLLWVLGVLLLPYNPFDSLELGFLLIFSALFFLVLSFIIKRGFKFLENLVLAFLVIVVVSFLCLINENPRAINLSNETKYSVILKVKERYKQTDYQNKYIVEVESVLGDSLIPINLDYLLLQNRDSLSNYFVPGERFVAHVYTKEFSIQKHPALFNSKRYWYVKNVQASIWLQNNEITNLESSNNWYYTIRALQIKGLNLINLQNIGEDTKQILAALLLGDKRGVDKEISNQFAQLGLIHTLALSGLHISLVYGICAFLLSVVLRHRAQLQSIILVLIIITYAIITGLSPSVMRASLMFLLYAFSLLINRRTTALNIVFLSALLLLIYNYRLLYDIGFQLSYSAVIGIVYFYNKCKFLIENKNVVSKFFFGLALVSISAQLSTSLLSVYYFHSFPLSFLWANVIVLPLITVLLYQGLLYMVLLITGFNFNLFDVFIDQSVDFLLSILSFLERYSFSPLPLYISTTGLLFMYGLLLLICIVFIEKNFKYLKFLYVYILTIVFCFMFSGDSAKKELFINASNQAYVISVIANNEQVLISNDYKTVSFLLGSYSIRNRVVCIDSLNSNSIYSNGFVNVSKELIQLFDERLFVISSQSLNMDAIDSVDLLLMQKYRSDIVALNRVFTPKVVLLDAGMSNKNRLKLKLLWQDLNVEIVDLKTTAYVKAY